jgi:ribonuclease HI
MAEPAVLHIHTDGASRGNPGAAAYAFVIRRPDGEVIEEADCLGRMTNNQAEYTALVRALERALGLGAEHGLSIHSDSELMVKQMRGEYRVKNEELRDLYEQARELAGRFRGRVTFQHVRRGDNTRADALCNEALDGKRGRGCPAPPSLREQAVACLRRAGVAAPEALWGELATLMEKNGVRLP